MYHGLFCIIERLGFKNCLEKSKILSVVYSFLVVNFGWVLFRAGDIAVGFSMLARMLGPWEYGSSGNTGDSAVIGNIGSIGEGGLRSIIEQTGYVSPKTIFIFVCAVLGAGLLKQVVPAKIADKWRDSALEAFYCVILLVLCLASIASDTYNPFIYFQF
jgi:alginate O-acetyltransferase complex protein AlgI